MASYVSRCKEGQIKAEIIDYHINLLILNAFTTQEKQKN